MTTEIVPAEQAEITVLELAGQAANHAAASHVFDEYRQRKAANTLKAQAGDLALFADFLASAGVDSGELAADPAAWRGVTWGLVEAFKQALLREGYAIGSLNRALSTIKRYAALAVIEFTFGHAGFSFRCVLPVRSSTAISTSTTKLSVSRMVT